MREPSDLDGLDGLMIPGGESTTLSMLLESSGLFDPIAEALAAGLPVFGTCAGMILLAGTVLDGRDDQRRFGAIDLVIRRNGYGRQVASFECDLAGGRALGAEPLPRRVHPGPGGRERPARRSRYWPRCLRPGRLGPGAGRSSPARPAGGLPPGAGADHRLPPRADRRP